MSEGVVQHEEYQRQTVNCRKENLEEEGSVSVLSS